jgi:hypothetical protein
MNELGWQTTSSKAIRLFRFLPDEDVLEIVYRGTSRSSRTAYAFPCDERLYQAFLTAWSKGRFVEKTLKPYAQRLGWSVRSRPFPNGSSA